jgi:hypothetical protein
MTKLFPRWPRRIAAGILALGLIVSPAATPSLRAQAPGEAAPEAAASTGRPLDGYLGTITLVLLALFIVGKSARR